MPKGASVSHHTPHFDWRVMVETKTLAFSGTIRSLAGGFWVSTVRYADQTRALLTWEVGGSHVESFKRFSTLFHVCALVSNRNQFCPYSHASRNIHVNTNTEMCLYVCALTPLHTIPPLFWCFFLNGFWICYDISNTSLGCM